MDKQECLNMEETKDEKRRYSQIVVTMTKRLDLNQSH